jgi:hypothetical protein
VIDVSSLTFTVSHKLVLQGAEGAWSIKKAKLAAKRKRKASPPMLLSAAYFSLLSPVAGIASRSQVQAGRRACSRRVVGALASWRFGV